MRPLAVFDIIALFATITALTILVRGWQRSLQRDSKILFSGLFTLTLFLNLSNVLEWTGISAALDPLEDFIEILVPVIWFLIFYVFLQEMVTSELGKHTHYYRTLLDSLHEDIIVIDRNYSITDINNNFLMTSGLNRAEVIGQKCFDLLHSQDRQCRFYGEDCKLEEVFETGKPCSCRHEHWNQNGLKNWVDILTSPIKNQDNKVTHVIEAIRDITDMTMPEMTGDLLTRELIRIRPDIPVILCTGFSAKIDEQKAMAMGIKAFILKPIVKRDIAAIIRKVLK
jgi:PAS domain S-box-containing protein